MKVLCINSETKVLPIPLEEGKVYEVKESSCGCECCYYVPDVYGNCHKDRFIPLSLIDERELIEQRENNLVNK